MKKQSLCLWILVALLALPLFAQDSQGSTNAPSEVKKAVDSLNQAQGVALKDADQTVDKLSADDDMALDDEAMGDEDLGLSAENDLSLDDQPVKDDVKN